MAAGMVKCSYEPNIGAGSGDRTDSCLSYSIVCCAGSGTGNHGKKSSCIYADKNGA